jgi:hypothetical protein
LLRQSNSSTGGEPGPGRTRPPWLSTRASPDTKRPRPASPSANATRPSKKLTAFPRRRTTMTGEGVQPAQDVQAETAEDGDDSSRAGGERGRSPTYGR